MSLKRKSGTQCRTKVFCHLLCYWLQNRILIAFNAIVNALGFWTTSRCLTCLIQRHRGGTQHVHDSTDAQEQQRDPPYCWREELLGNRLSKLDNPLQVCAQAQMSVFNIWYTSMIIMIPTILICEMWFGVYSWIIAQVSKCQIVIMLIWFYVAFLCIESVPTVPERLLWCL